MVLLESTVFFSTTMTFLENYQVLDSYIQLLNESGPVQLRELSPFTHIPDVKKIKTLLLNAWSAEYALRITPVVNDEQYLQSSLHWTFPQAYYSTLFSARAFLLSIGYDLSNEDLIRRKIGNLVVSGYYPKSLGFYVYNTPPNCVARRLPRVPLLESFLFETRKKQIENAKRGLKPLKQQGYSIQQIALPLGYTTYFDLMSRLRISSTNREIERYTTDSIDVKAFHQSLVNIVSHINRIHESYIASRSLLAYRIIINSIPSYLQEGFVQQRFNEVVEPSVKADIERFNAKYAFT